MHNQESILVKDKLFKGLGNPDNPWELKAKTQLIECGYSFDDTVREPVMDALMQGGEIVSRKTGCVWINHGLPETPPGFIRPGKLRIGNKVHVLNWVPMGVHGAVIDLKPRNGTINRMLVVKCKIACGPIACDRWPMDEIRTLDEERVYALGLEDKDGIFPLLLKDYSLVMRLDSPSALPGGETRVYV